MIWEGVAGAILLAILAGLMTLAYKHPTGYARLHEVLWRAFTVMFFLYFVFGVGVMTGRSTLWPFVALDRFEQAQASGPSLEWIFLYPMLIYAASLCYFGFLRYLPKLVGRDQDYVPQAGFVIPLVREGTTNKPTRTKKKPQLSKNKDGEP